MNNIEIGVSKAIYVYKEPINMSKSFNGLFELVKHEMHKRPESGDVFLFVNRHGDYIKIFTWHNNGWLILAKRLAAGKFAMPTKKVIELEDLQRIVDAFVAQEISLDTQGARV